MNWKMAYVVLRPTESGTVTTVYEINGLKEARYWLTYIANPGDALFSTPAHPKYSGSGEPTYVSHLAKRGKLEYSEADWRKNHLKADAMQIAPASAA